MFLPDDYKAPSTNKNYMKLQQGENRLRILSRPILGWEDWKDNKPLRYPFDKKPSASIDPKKPVKHFWAFIVWNYGEESIQILSLTQATIRANIEALCKDTDWGAPYFYDIKIIKTGEKTDTEYMVNPLPHKPVSKEIIMAFKEKRCNMQAFLNCLDPFAGDWPEYTPGIFSQADLDKQLGEKMSNKVSRPTISKEEAIEIIDLVSDCSPEHKEFVVNFLKTNNLASLYDLTPEIFVKLKDKSLRDKREYQLTKDISAGPDPFEGVA